MNSLLKCLFITVISVHTAGCSFFEQSPDVEYITPMKDVSINIGKSVIVHGAMESCTREARFWSDVSHLLPYSETGFFSNAGVSLMKSKKCRGLTRVLAVRFTANKVGSENLTVLGDPMNIVVSSDNTNFLQSTLPNPKVAAEPKKPSMLDTFLEWVDRDGATNTGN